MCAQSFPYRKNDRYIVLTIGYPKLLHAYFACIFCCFWWHIILNGKELLTWLCSTWVLILLPFFYIFCGSNGSRSCFGMWTMAKDPWSWVNSLYIREDSNTFCIWLTHLLKWSTEKTHCISRLYIHLQIISCLNGGFSWYLLQKHSKHAFDHSPAA